MNIKEFENYKRLPSEIIVQLTTGCNLRCNYCFQHLRKTHHMDIELAKKTVDFIMSRDENCVRTLNFYGGEPLLNKKAMEAIVDRYIELKEEGNATVLYFYVNTNGTLIDDEFIRIAKKLMKVATFKVSVSINGNRDSHDASRKDINNNPTFDLIMKNIKKLRDEIPDIDIECHSVSDRAFIKDFKNNLKFMINNELFDTATSEPMFWGTGEEYTKEDFEKIVDVYNELKEEGYNTEKLYAMIEGFLEKENYKNIQKGTPMICIPGSTVMCIDSYGKFLPCDYYLNLDNYSEFTMGDIFGDYSNYNKKVDYYTQANYELYWCENSCQNEKGVNCKTECDCSSGCSICNSAAEILTKKKLVIPTGMCERTKLMTQVFKEKKFKK